MAGRLAMRDRASVDGTPSSGHSTISGLHQAHLKPSVSPPPQSRHEQPPRGHRPRRPIIVLGIGALLFFVVVLALSLGLYFGLRKDKSNPLAGPVPEPHDGPEVDLGYSRYRGSSQSNGLREYLGIPYAQPPTGDLRWRAPVAPEATDDVQMAQRHKPGCLSWGQTPNESASEDCLYVNIWTPSNATTDDKFPVMVYFQGGGYNYLSDPFLNGSRIVETSGNRIVLVTFNYRVSVYGFLAGKAVQDDGALNAGILDQRFLLHWIQDNIAKFGGDPDRVVLQGMSAGAGSVSLQLAAYAGRDDRLFSGAIFESTFWPGQSNVSAVEYQFDRLVQGTACGNAEKSIACLRNKTTDELQDNNKALPFEGRSGAANFYWLPVTDGDLLRDTLYNLYDEGRFVKVPVLIGSCTNEGTSFAPDVATPQEFSDFMMDQYPRLGPNETKELIEAYPEQKKLPNWAEWWPSAALAYGEGTFNCPTNHIAQALSSSQQSTAGSPVWSYRYNLQSEALVSSGIGVPHVFEIAAVFGPENIDNADPSYFTYNAGEVPIVMNYWISFVRSLNPNTYRYNGTPEWQQWGGDRRRLVLELKDSAMESVPETEAQRCEVWYGMKNATGQ